MINFKHSNIASLCNHQATKHGGVPWNLPPENMAAAVQLLLGDPSCRPRCGADFLKIYLDVSKNNGTPKMDGFIMENPFKMDDLGGPPLFLETSI